MSEEHLSTGFEDAAQRRFAIAGASGGGERALSDTLRRGHILSGFSREGLERASQERSDSAGPCIRIFAGTTEGRELCEWLSANGVAARAYTATDYGAELVDDLPLIEVHAGRLDEEAMEAELAGCSVVVDATHPYAAIVSANIEKAAAAVEARYLRVLRPAVAVEGDVVSVASIEEAARFLAAQEGRALITTGSKEIEPFARVAGFEERFYVRVLPAVEALEKCLAAGFSPSHVICMQGPFTRELNAAMLQQLGCGWLVTKNAGRVGGTDSKLAAARDAGARVVMVSRPNDHETGFTLEEAKTELSGLPAFA